MKKLLLLILSFSLIAGTMLPATAENVVLPVFETDIAYEAENALLYDTWFTTADDVAASGGTVIKTNGTAQLTAADVTGPMLAFNVYSPEKLTGCKLLIKYKSPNGSTSFFHRANGATEWTVVYPKKAADYTWFEVPSLSLTLNKGNNLIELAQRTKGFTIDQIKVTGCAKEYAEPTITSGVVTYPEFMEPNRINTVPPFEDGDNILFIGDSITHGSVSGEYLGYLSTYYAGRFPDKKITYLNKAIGGNDAGEALKRLNYDIFNGIDATANKAVILLGTNDMEQGNYYEGTDLYNGEIWRRANSLTNYKKNMTKLIEGLRAKGIEDIILVSPPFYDEIGTTQTSKVSIGFNNVARKAAKFQYELSQTMEDVYFIDINTPMYMVDAYNKELSGNDFNIIPDRTHPSEVGNWIIAYSILKAQGLGGDVASVDIDVSSQTAEAKNAEVTSLNVSENSVAYTYSPKAIPFGADSVYREADTLIPLTRDFNREIIRVTGLAEGVYDIKINGKVAMRAGADELEIGVNIADKESNPGQQSGLKALGFALARIDYDSPYRQLQYDAQSYINSYSLDVSSNEALIASAEAYLASTTNSTAKTKLTKFLTDKAAEEETLSAIKDLENVVYSCSVPVTSKVEIALSADQAEPGRIDYSFDDIELPQDTLDIIPNDKAPGVSVDRIVFEDENGDELTSLPSSGKVKVTATLRNNTLSDVKSTLWISSYGENNLNSANFTDVALIGAGKELDISGELTINEASLLLKAGVWEDTQTIAPHMASAEYPSDNYGIKAVYVDNRKLSFEPGKYEYTYVLPLEETKAPKVSIIPSNTNADIKITQATSVKDSAVIKAGDKTYTISFKISDPHLTGIKINGTDFEDFVADAYYYELPVSSMGTVSGEAGYDVAINITQPTTSNPTAVITTEAYNGESRTYTLKFIDRNIGEVTGIKWKGTEAASTGSNCVVPVQSLGVTLADYTEVADTPEETLEKLQNDKVYENNAYSIYSTSYRRAVGMWSKLTNNTYGYMIQFMYADAGSSFLLNENVTRLYKPDVDINSTYISAGADPAKIYEFTISKPAMVYITTPTASTYIAGLGAGWTYEFDEAKYSLYSPSYEDWEMEDGNILRVPTGGTAACDVAKGHAYYQHFDAGATVQIPAYSATSSNRQLGIFIVWDEVQ